MYGRIPLQGNKVIAYTRTACTMEVRSLNKHQRKSRGRMKWVITDTEIWIKVTTATNRQSE